MSDGIYANVQPGLPADVASCCHYRSQVLTCSTRSVREICLCTQVEALYGEVQRISDSSGRLDSRNVGIRSSAKEYLGTCAGRDSSPHVC